MDNELLELAMKRIADLEKRVERYFTHLEVNNELDFILKGGYILKSDLDEVLFGENQVEEEIDE